MNTARGITKGKNRWKRPIIGLIGGFGIASLALGAFLLIGNTIQAQDTGLTDQETQSILDLNSQINEKRKAVEDLEKKALVYEETARKKQQESKTLETELQTIDQSLEQTVNEIEKTQIQIDQFTLEIRQVEGSIEKRSNEIDDTKLKIGEFIRVINRTNAKTYLEISFTNDTFSRFFMREKAMRDIEQEMKKSLDRLEILKTDLENQRKDLASKKADLDEAKNRLDANQKAQEQEKLFKEAIIGRIQEEAVTYQQLTDEARAEYDQAVGEANALETRFRQKLDEQNVDLDKLLGDASQFLWPINPTRGISAYFHDPNYGWGVHTGVDIPAPQGTPVRAAADGVVAAARQPYMISPGNPGYSWIAILHGGNVSSQYWHMSQVNVQVDQYVRKGDIIGLSGGTPGVAGSGWRTTGAHLHFEARVNGLPVDPMSYLQ